MKPAAGVMEQALVEWWLPVLGCACEGATRKITRGPVKNVTPKLPTTASSPVPSYEAHSCNRGCHASFTFGGGGVQLTITDVQQP